MAITLGSQFQVDTDGDDRVRFSGLTSTTGIALYSSAASGIEARHLTNTAGTITGGTVLAIDGNAADTLCICRLTDTSALIGYAYGATHRVRILTVSGTTLTANAVTNMTDTGVTFADCDALTSTKVIYCYKSTTGTGDGVARVLTISGTTITENAAFTYENGFAANNTAVGAFPDAISAIVFFNSNAEILDISGTTITGNSSHFESGMSTGGGDNQAALAIDPGDATIISIVSCNGGDSGRIQRFDRSGGSLSAAGNPGIMSPGNNVTSISITAIDSDRTIVSTLDPTNSRIIFQTYAPSTKTLADTDTTISVGAGASSTEISLLPGSTTAIAVWEGTTESISASLPSFSHLWLSTDGGATYTNIGDSAWAANVVGGVVAVPGTAYQTIFAAVGTSLYKTINGGTAWTLETAIGYEVDFIDLEKDNTTVFLAKRDAAGTNRASLWDSVGASLSHINTGKSTTGGATSGGDVV